MSFLHTVDILALLQQRLESLALEPEDAGSTEKLFQRVGAFGANKLAQAMKAVFASEQRVCFLVPGGDAYTGARDPILLRSVRSTRVALLIADKSVDLEKNAALIGGAQNLGILEMKDRVIDDLVTTQFTPPDVVFEPGEGEPLVITDADKPAGNLGRECWLQWLSCYAGEVRQAVPH